jgi:hypothetical protein
MHFVHVLDFFRFLYWDIDWLRFSFDEVCVHPVFITQLTSFCILPSFLELRVFCLLSGFIRAKLGYPDQTHNPSSILEKSDT